MELKTKSPILIFNLFTDPALISSTPFTGTPEEIDYAHIYAVIGDYTDGTEDGTLDGFRHVSEHIIYLFLKTSRKHLISLVQDKALYIFNEQFFSFN